MTNNKFVRHKVKVTQKRWEGERETIFHDAWNNSMRDEIDTFGREKKNSNSITHDWHDTARHRNFIPRLYIRKNFVEIIFTCHLNSITFPPSQTMKQKKTPRIIRKSLDNFLVLVVVFSFCLHVSMNLKHQAKKLDEEHSLSYPTPLKDNGKARWTSRVLNPRKMLKNVKKTEKEKQTVQTTKVYAKRGEEEGEEKKKAKYIPKQKLRNAVGRLAYYLTAHKVQDAIL